MSDIFVEHNPSEAQPRGSTLDFKRVLARAIRFWYLVVLFLVASIAITVYNTRYTQRIYPISASIVIRETQETAGGEFLYKNPLIDGYRNYLNEPYIIKSYPVVEKVIRDLGFEVSFLREGYFLTTESYNYLPVKVKWINPEESSGGSFLFSVVDDNKFSLMGMQQNENPELFSFGDSINFKGRGLYVAKQFDRKIKPFIGIQFIMSLQHSRDIAGSYISRLNVSWAEEGAGVINLGINGTNPDKEIDFLNGLISTYSQFDLDKKNETAQRTIMFISDQLLAIRDSLKMVELQFQRFGKSSKAKDLSADAERLLVKAESLESQRTELIIKSNYLDYLDEYLKDDPVLGQVILPASMGINDPVISNLVNQIIDLQVELRLHLDPEKRTNPLVQSQQARLKGIRNDLKEALVSLRASDKIKYEFYDRQVREIELRLSEIPTTERQLITVQRTYSLLENLYVFLMQKYFEAQISEASNISDIKLVNPAMRGGVISPKPIQNYTIGVIVGLIIPLLIFVLFELVNNKVQSKEDIESSTAIPFIGGVGHNSNQGDLVVKEKPKSGLAESFRALRSNLNFFTGGQPGKVFLVTSSISGEGKTFTTINLATVFALSGKRTLIVGADMRRPKIFQDFNRSNDIGLSTFLSGASNFEQIIQETEIENLFLVSGGPVPPNPSELLLTSKFEQFVKSSLEVFDFVLIDTPPLALVTDAFVMSKLADHTVFVMRQNYSPKEFVRSIDDYYRSGKIKNISILLNDIYKSGLGYGYGQSYAYQYGYGYGSYGGYGYYSDK